MSSIPKLDSLPHARTVESETRSASSSKRWHAIDFWRGVVLCFIFVNHVPGNIFEILTPKNYGFSDSAEAFVFLSGVSLALAFGRRFMAGKTTQVMHSLEWRAAKLYGIHLFLSFAAVAIFALGATLGHDGDLMNVHGRDLFMDDPPAALIGLLSLGHQLGYFNILPLYIVLIGILALQLWVARLGVMPMLLASFSLYVAVRLFGWNIPTWPMKGTWFFNPLAWQFLMALGVAAGLMFRERAMPRNPLLLILAGLVAAFGAFSVTNGLSTLPGFQDWTAQWADLDKTDLGLGRVVHFAAVAYLIYGIGLSNVMKRLPIYEPLCLIGRNSLAIFAILSLLAAFGQVLTRLFGNTVGLDVVLIGGGVAALYGAARMLELWSPAGFPGRGRLRAGHGADQPQAALSPSDG